ncbi:flap endonuclease-1 [Candidatus Woesearchaeota archaeon]|nr:MAG: flap endonuclease-1 [Candidatus Woesearchaeota archaeon]
MGVQLKEIITKKEVDFAFFKGKILVIDAHNNLYQYLTTIRQRDGSPLTDSHGNVTSHLSGLLNRTVNLISLGINVAFVFDGKPPELKKEELEKRKSLKIAAQKKYEVARERGDIEEMRKQASRTSRLTEEMIREAKELIKAFGLPAIQAPSEGEAQAAYIVKKGDAFASVSQDYDSLLFGAPKLVQNLTSSRRKMPNKQLYERVMPCLISLDENLNNLGIDSDQLIALAMLVGTDFNPGGIRGIGPKNALKLVKEHKKDFNKLFSHVKWDDYISASWEEIFSIFKEMPVSEDYSLEWSEPDTEKIIKILVDKHDFSEERVNNTLSKLKKKSFDKAQKGLNDFFN